MVPGSNELRKAIYGDLAIVKGIELMEKTILDNMKSNDKSQEKNQALSVKIETFQKETDMESYIDEKLPFWVRDFPL